MTRRAGSAPTVVGVVDWITTLAARDTPGFLRAVACATFGLTRHAERATWNPELRAALAHADRVGRERDDGVLWSDVDSAVYEQVDDAFGDGVLAGLGLARTWPSGPEGIEDWPRRATEHAGLVRDGSVDPSGEGDHLDSDVRPA